MKRITINEYQIGLVFKNGVYQRVLEAGKYFFWKNEQVYIHELMKPFNPFIDLSILLQDAALAERLQVVEVKDNEIALHFKQGVLQEVLPVPGRYAYWKAFNDRHFVVVNTSHYQIPDAIDAALLQHRLMTPYIRTHVVEQYENAVLLVDGVHQQMLQPGVYHWFKNTQLLNVAKVDLRQQQLEINGQEMLTKDKAALRINAWAQYQVTDLEKAVLQNKEYDKQLYVSIQLALREYVAGFGLDELLEKKEAIASFVLQSVQTVAAGLGVLVKGFGIRDIILPGDMKEIMNQVLVAEKRAQANSIMRREETASTRSLLNTAKLMEDNSILWKLKEMEYVEKIADKISNISVNGNGALIEQLKGIFVPK